VKVGGFGPIEAVSAVSRFDKTKKADEATASAAPEKAAEKSAALSSSSSTLSSKRAPRSSTVSKESAKDFSRVLNETEKSRDLDEDSEPNELAGSTAVAMQSRPVERPEARPEKPEAKGESRLSVVAHTGDQKLQNAESKAATGETTTTVDDKINDIIESLEQTADTELSMRHLSMREFLGKMQGEFGIEPQQIVKAFANLDQVALQAPPEQTAQAVLAQLNLKPEQMPKAEAFYREMLNETGESALSETMAGVGAGMTLKVLSEQDLALEKLQKSIVSLNDAFARRSEVAPEIAASPMMLAMQAASVDADETAALPKPEAEVAGKKEEKSSDSKFASLGAALSAASASLAANSGQGAGGTGADSQGSKSETPKPKEFNSIESALAASGFSISSGSEKSATPLMAGTSTAAALATAVATPDGEATASNAQNLVRNAQILMKNGGGEMKMQLKPEGVGEVTLKVAVKDGQVAIQMMTENDSAKKMLESNLDDLKTSLAQHKLHVDALKIEVGGDLAKQRFEQAQQDTNRDQARQMAQDFMGQFREDRQGFRQGFFDQSGFKNYQQPNRNPLPTVEPVVTSSGSQEKSTGERRLNLVA
jgi:flagellar hook-length control protein FliK